LKLDQNYTTATAALLLALYIFIATPISYWHQHSGSCGNNNNSKQNSLVIKISGSNEVVNCKICSHHYSASANDAIIVDLFPDVYTIQHREFYLLKSPSNSGYIQSNKGPPPVLA
jgi:hypothetical protein